MKILALIPARGGSKGVPGKNIKLLQGKPLLYYTLDTVLKLESVEEVCVSSDDARIIDLANSYDENRTLAPFVRPGQFANDRSPTIGVIQHALEYYDGLGKQFDAVALFQPTVPFRSVSMIEKCIAKLVDSNADSIVSVREVPHNFNPHWVFEDDGKNMLKIATGEGEMITQRQQLPSAFYRDGSLYITRTDVIKSGSLYGNRISYLINTDEPHFNIDTMEDWALMEASLK